MPENVYSTVTDSKPLTQFSLTAMIETIPESIAYLRGGLYRLPKAVAPEGSSETMNTNAPGPKPPMNLDVIDAADLQLENLSYWAEYCGASMRDIGYVWRYHRNHPELAGEIRGILYDDPRPADRLSARLLAIMRGPDWVEPEGMHSHLHALLARHATTWPAIHDLLLQARHR